VTTKSLTAHQRWAQLEHKRKGMLDRFEQYAAVTIPSVCLPDNVSQFTSSIQHDWTSFGAQAVNHLVNKLNLTLFRPGAPFFRLDPSREMRAQLAAMNVPEEDMRTLLVTGEQDAMRIMDQRALRPVLNEIGRHLVITGNVAWDTTEPETSVIGVKDFVVKRSRTGRLTEILHRRRLLYNELEMEVQSLVSRAYTPDNEEGYVCYYRWFRRVRDKWYLEQWVDDDQLPEDYMQVYEGDTLPIHILTWNLASNQDYGTGMVEEYSGDFSTLSTLSEAEIKAAILASDYRWLANPQTIGDIDDVRNSTTGDVIAAGKDDLSIVALGSAEAVQHTAASVDRVIRRLGQAFLMGSAVTRDAERVTAEEIRLQAMELETSLGGIYSRLAVDLQVPVAIWLLEQIDIEIRGTQLVPTVVTGLSALSRSMEAQAVMRFLSGLAQVGSLPPDVSARLKLSPIISVLAASEGLDPTKYVKSEEQVAEEQAAAQQAAMEQQARLDASKEGAKALANRSHAQ